MARIPPLDLDTAPPEARALFERDIAAYGEPLNTTRIAARRPEIAQAVGKLGKAIADGGLIPGQLRFLVNVRIASLVGCVF